VRPLWKARAGGPGPPGERSVKTLGAGCPWSGFSDMGRPDCSIWAAHETTSMWGYSVRTIALVVPPFKPAWIVTCSGLAVVARFEPSISNSKLK
jgi:hypothetical protein